MKWGRPQGQGSERERRGAPGRDSSTLAERGQRQHGQRCSETCALIVRHVEERQLSLYAQQGNN